MDPDHVLEDIQFDATPDAVATARLPRHDCCISLSWHPPSCRSLIQLQATLYRLASLHGDDW